MRFVSLNGAFVALKQMSTVHCEDMMVSLSENSRVCLFQFKTDHHVTDSMAVAWAQHNDQYQASHPYPMAKYKSIIWKTQMFPKKPHKAFTFNFF